MTQAHSPEVSTSTTASGLETAAHNGDRRHNSPASIMAHLRRWIVQRAVLYVLTQTPMIALVVGFVFKWISYPVAMALIVLPIVIFLPAWIVYRRRASSDPHEPSNQFGRIALWAIFPVIVFDLARIPMHYVLGNVFWGTWFDFGSSLTGQPPSHWTSLAVGTFLHIFQGYVLALGYYILFPRAKLRSALDYLFFLLSAIYSLLFPRYVILGPTPFKWYLVIWWAHLWFALTAWAAPRLDKPALRRWLRRPAIAPIGALVLIVLAAAPFSFVFWRVDTWQFPRQNATDAGAFTHLALAPNPAIVVTAADTSGEAEYRATFRLGPRDYDNFMGTPESLAAVGLRITGEITAPAGPVAFCADTIASLPSAAALATPATFAADVKRMDFTRIQVICVGPAASLAALKSSPAGSVYLRWTATATLDADRDSAVKSFSGNQKASVAGQ